MAKIIRNDDISKLQEISSQSEFDFDQFIPSSIYEKFSKCYCVEKHLVSIINYAAFYGAEKCFKFLLMNGSNIENTGKYAVAGGNIEIIHLCEQNGASFQGAFKAAIKFHQNNIFYYLYEKGYLHNEDNYKKSNILLKRNFNNFNFINSQYKPNKSNYGLLLSNPNTDESQSIFTMIDSFSLNQNQNVDESKEIKFDISTINQSFSRPKNDSCETNDMFSSDQNPEELQNESSQMNFDVFPQNQFIGNHINLFNEKDCLTSLATKCIKCNNYEIFTFLEKKGISINDPLIKEVFSSGNIYIAKYLFEGLEFPVEALPYAVTSRNKELVNYVLGKKGIDVNIADNINFVCLLI